MRGVGFLVLVVGLVSACDDRPPLEDRMKGVKIQPQAQESASVAAPPAPPPPVAKRAMPPRPVPIGSSGPIQPSAPADQQMMAIQYTLAMVTPDSGDPFLDKAYVDDVSKKLETAARAADKAKTPDNPVRVANGGRKIMVEIGKGCIDRMPLLLVQRAGSSLKAAFDAGVLVVACHDDKWECHQSTRDQNDVLCLAAPRR